MAPSLAAVPDPVTASVGLTVTGATGAITVTRFVAGQPGVRVRGTFVNGRLVPDRDAPLNVPLVYIAADTAGQSPQVTVELASDSAVLTLMDNPSVMARVIVLSDVSQEYVGMSTPHKILATNIPLVTVEPTMLRAGTFTFHLPTLTDWLALRAVILPGGVILLRSPCQTELLDTAFMMRTGRLDLPWNRPGPRHRTFTLDYQATSPDTTPAQEYAWTYDDVPGAVATYDDLPLEFATYDDLATFVPGAP